MESRGQTINTPLVARAIRELWLKGMDGQGCIPGGSADVLVKLLEWGVTVKDYELTDRLKELADMGCFTLEQGENNDSIRRHGNYSICDLNWQLLSRYELFGKQEGHHIEMADETKRTNPAEPKHILVVDDAEEMLLLLEQILQDEAGYRVTKSTPGPHVIESVKKIKPDLVITDLLHKGHNHGQTLIEEMRSDLDTIYIPIIICTGSNRDIKEQESEFAELGIGVILKPFDVDELLLAVETRLKAADPAPMSEIQPHGHHDQDGHREQ